jgi:UDP-4-amino-4,6-dideoxy-N-acetyl-beta-L-altrosamine transaminase
MISYGKQFIDQSDIDAVVNVLKSDWLTQGPAVETFENDLKNYFGARHTCAVANGTAALHLTGLALGWQPDDIVITSPITFLATANCIVYAGATPDFADIDPLTYTIDPNMLEEKIKAHQSKGKKAKAVIGVDYAGHPCDWKALREIADKYDLQLVNDNSHALGASYFGDKQYAVKYADVVTQSYHPVKHITTGEGGAIITNDATIGEKVKRLSNHGMTKNPDQLERNDGSWYYEMHDVGYNYRITDFQCALGSSQLQRLDQFVQKRREIAGNYNESFSNNDMFLIPEIHDFVDHAYHLYPLQIVFEELSFTKPHFFQKMKQAGIRLQVHYIPLHIQPFYKNKYGFESGDFPVSENFYDRVVSIPLYPSFTDAELEEVVTDISSFVKSK